MSTHSRPEEEASTHDAWPEEEDPWEAADREWNSWGDEWGDEGDEWPSSSAEIRTSRGEAEQEGRESPRLHEGRLSVAEAYTEGMREAGPYLGLGAQIAGTMALFVAGGYFLDRWLHSSPWGILVGAVVAFVAILMLVIRLAKQAEPEGGNGNGKKRSRAMRS